jgi:hypothetical protein
MSRELVIQVNINPQTSAGPTETRETTNVVQQQAISRGTVAMQQAKQGMDLVGRNAYNFALMNVGELTGNRRLQRQLQAGNFLFNIAAIAKINPGVAVAMAGIQLASSAAQTAIENRNLNIQIEYNKQLQVNNYNNNRR